jgi:hypothetical protein
MGSPRAHVFGHGVSGASSSRGTHCRQPANELISRNQGHLLRSPLAYLEKRWSTSSARPRRPGSRRRRHRSSTTRTPGDSSPSRIALGPAPGAPHAGR